MRKLVIQIENSEQLIILYNHYCENNWIKQNVEKSEMIKSFSNYNYPVYVIWKPHGGKKACWFTARNFQYPPCDNPKISTLFNGYPKWIQEQLLKEYEKCVSYYKIRRFFDTNLIKGSKK